MCLPYAKKNWSVVARYFSLYHLFLYLYRQLLKPDKFESNTEFLMQSSSHSSQESWYNEPYVYYVHIPPPDLEILW